MSRSRAVVSIPVWPLLLGLTTLWSAAHAQDSRAPQGATRPRFLTPAEILQKMETSKVSYDVHDPESAGAPAQEQYAQLWWPLEEPLDTPIVEKSADGSAHVSAYPKNAEADRLLQQAEPAFKGNRFAEAEKLYEQALKLAPGYYPALLAYGDAAFFSGKPEVALQRYRQATQSNPDDHRGYFFQANALLALGKKEQARDAYAWALALRPQNPYVLQALDTKKARTLLGASVQPLSLDKPRSFARKTDKGVELWLDAKQPHWLIWGMCKALWLGEPTHRQEMTGSTTYTWTLTEEMECLNALLATYTAPNRQSPPDPRLERLLKVAKDGFAPELVVYEVASRMSPHVVLSQDESRRKRMHAYVLRYVLTPTP